MDRRSVFFFSYCLVFTALHKLCFSCQTIFTLSQQHIVATLPTFCFCLILLKRCFTSFYFTWQVNGCPSRRRMVIVVIEMANRNVTGSSCTCKPLLPKKISHVWCRSIKHRKALQFQQQALTFPTSTKIWGVCLFIHSFHNPSRFAHLCMSCSVCTIL